jgi:multicomponent Na+:H+ antiporter subunit E
MITLTPGTLSVDVSADRKTLFIHAIDIESRDRLVGHIAAGFETKILGVLRK